MNAQAKKILDVVWCEDAPNNRIDPEKVGIDRATGWTIEYEQNKYPERKVWNQLFREIQGALREYLREGILAWQDDLEYPQYSFVKHNRRLYYSTTSVPAGGLEPGISALWRRY